MEQENWSSVIQMMWDLPCKINFELSGVSQFGETFSWFRPSSNFYLTIYSNNFDSLNLFSSLCGFNWLNRVIGSAYRQTFHSVSNKFSNVLELSSRASSLVGSGFVPSLVKVHLFGSTHLQDNVKLTTLITELLYIILGW